MKLVVPSPAIVSFKLAVFVSGSRIFHSPVAPFKFNVPLLEIVLSIAKPFTFVLKVPP